MHLGHVARSNRWAAEKKEMRLWTTHELDAEYEGTHFILLYMLDNYDSVKNIKILYIGRGLASLQSYYPTLTLTYIGGRVGHVS